MLAGRNKFVHSFVEALFRAENERELLVAASEQLGELFSVDRTVVIASVRNGLSSSPVEWSLLPPDPALDPASVKLAYFLDQLSRDSRVTQRFDDVTFSPILDPIRPSMVALGVSSLLAVTGYFQDEPQVTIILQQIERSQPGGRKQAWYNEEVRMLESLSHLLAAARYSVVRQENRTEGEGQPAPWNELTEAMVVQFSSEGQVLSVNRKFEEMSGLQGSDVIGEYFDAVIQATVVPEDQSAVLKDYREAFLGEGKESALIEYRVRHGMNKQLSWVIDRLAPTRNSRGKVTGVLSVALDISAKHEAEEQLRRSERRYRRLVEHSDAIIFHADAKHAISFISRRALDFFGTSPEDFVATGPVYWFDLIHDLDRNRVVSKLREVEREGGNFDEEVRIVNRVTGSSRWLLIRLVPVRGNRGDLEGWDGFGVDITGRREAQEALEIQSRKIRALYTVSSAIRGFLDPPNIAARGLAALCDATGADAGVCYLLEPDEERKLGLTAHCGFPRDFPDQAVRGSGLQNLAEYVARTGQAVVVSDIRNDPRAGRALAETHGMLSAVLVPVSVEEESLGTLGLFSATLSSFDGGDVMLVSAAANQIGLAARQANLFTAYRRQTNNLAALYRMSHELTRNMPLEDVFAQAFAIIRDELGLKRLWLGLLNETGSRIVGQAAYGPGWKRRLVEVNVEIVGREHPLARVVGGRQPVVIDNANEVLREFGIRRVFSRLGIHAVALVPVIAGGQVLGVLAVQPSSTEMVLDEEAITLLSSLANEIGTVVLTKRLEERIGESEKMRTAGLLAAGIAHNFNNLLQAILGQASLLEMQSSSPEKVERASRLITEAAAKGADLVKKLLSFAHLEEPLRDACDVRQLIEQNIQVLRRSLGQSHRLILDLSDALPRAYVDRSQLLQVILAIVVNAKEAMSNGGTVEITTKHTVVDENSPHYEVPFGEYVLIGIRDSGIGMDEETKRRCFEPFFTTKNVDPASGLGMSGSGLGLAAAYALARRNGGRLVVDSRPGHGALFTIYIPVFVEEHSAHGAPIRSRITVESMPGVAVSRTRKSKAQPERAPEEIHGGGMRKERHLRVLSTENGEEQQTLAERLRTKSNRESSQRRGK